MNHAFWNAVLYVAIISTCAGARFNRTGEFEFDTISEISHVPL